jgi:hypothetical protein
MLGKKEIGPVITKIPIVSLTWEERAFSYFSPDPNHFVHY